MKERSPGERKKDFRQVNTGYSADEAQAEAQRCLQCKNPTCIKGCPVEINIPGFVKALAVGDRRKAIEILKDKNNLPAVCGRVCPQEEQCEKNCILARKDQSIAIGHLERFAADWEKQNPSEAAHPVRKTAAKAKIAVVGSGPAGLTCAGDLAKAGFDVTIFESLHEAGGVLRYGIPDFRLPGEVLDYELDNLRKRGVTIVLNSLIGRTKTIPDLFDEGFKAVFIGTGAGLPTFLNIPGENLNHIYSANEFLVRVNLMRAFEFPRHDTPIYVGKHVVVIGGGNTAMDAARTALRLGAEAVTLVYRRSREEMPARTEEVRHADEEGVRFDFLTAPLRFIGDEKSCCVRGIECVKMALGAPDQSGRRRPQEVAGSNFVIETDMVIEAIGLRPNPVLPSLTAGLTTNEKGHVVIDDRFMTSIPAVFAGGDIAGGDTVIQAMGMGKRAARAIIDYLTKAATR
jgi:glutamate synthase (NADPH/NADH) small chain